MGLRHDIYPKGVVARETKCEQFGFNFERRRGRNVGAA